MGEEEERRKGERKWDSPSVSAASITPPSNVKPRTDVPVTVGCLDTKNGNVGGRNQFASGT